MYDKLDLTYFYYLTLYIYPFTSVFIPIAYPLYHCILYF